MKIIRRLSEDEEKELFPDKTESENVETFIEDVLPYFFYNEDTNKRIIRRVTGKEGKNYNNYFLDNLFSLNNQKRSFYVINNKSRTMDSNYETYRRLVSEGFNSARRSVRGSQSKFSKFLEDTYKKTYHDSFDVLSRLHDYDNFLSNKLTIGRQTFKLFKFLISHNILSEDDVTEVTTNKKVDEDLLLCISRNVVDYIVASTNQSYSSCISLTRSGNLPGLGLAGLSIDPNRLFVFITKGNKKILKFRKTKLDHFSYITRWWALYSKKDEVASIRDYPGKLNVEERNEIFKFLNIKTYNYNLPPLKHLHSDEDRFVSKYSFQPARFINNLVAMIYLDYFGKVEDSKNGKISYTHKGMYGCPHLFNSDKKTFFNTESFEELEKTIPHCVYCDSFGGEHGDLTLVYDDGYVCNSCFDDRFSRCEECGEIYNRENLITDNNGMEICNYCEEEYYFTCDECGNFTHDLEEHTFDLIKKGTTISLCASCSNKLAEVCDWCDEEFLEEDLTFIKERGEYFCKKCYDETHEECDSCHTIVFTQDLSECGNCSTSF